MNHDRAPVLEAIEDFRTRRRGHRKEGRPEAERLFADAVGADRAVFTTCGSSISNHVAMLTVTGPGRKVLVDRNVHKSVVASLILAGADLTVQSLHKAAGGFCQAGNGCSVRPSTAPPGCATGSDASRGST